MERDSYLLHTWRAQTFLFSTDARDFTIVYYIFIEENGQRKMAAETVHADACFAAVVWNIIKTYRRQRYTNCKARLLSYCWHRHWEWPEEGLHNATIISHYHARYKLSSSAYVACLL